MISQIRTSPDRRNAIISDLYRLHCDGIQTSILYIFIVFVIYVICVEVVLSKNEEMLL